MVPNQLSCLGNWNNKPLLARLNSIFSYNCLNEFVRPALKTYKRPIWNYERADFDRFREVFSEYNLDEENETYTDSNVQLIDNILFQAANPSVPNTIVTIRNTS